MVQEQFSPTLFSLYLTIVHLDCSDGIDVMRTTGSFTLLPGAVSVPVIIPLVQDTTPEQEERLTVTLLAGEDVSLTVASTNVTILDTDSKKFI